MTISYALNSSQHDGWETPDEVLELVRSLSPSGRIGLDPCTTDANPCEAVAAFTPFDNGLNHQWSHRGLVYCNPPYGRGIGPWAEKMAHEGFLCGAEIVALLPARTDTSWWRRHVLLADAICFWHGRLKFKGAEAGAPFPSAIAYWGDRAKAFARIFGTRGWVIDPRHLNGK